MHFDSLKVLILGGGVSGVAAARLLLSKGSRVTLADGCDNPALRSAVEKVTAAGGGLWLGKKDLPSEDFDLCVASPAFAPDHDWIIVCRSRGVKIISELELGAFCWKGKILAVTGSKGKSSVVKLCSDTLNLAGISASPAGNYGIPLSYLALEKPDLEWAVTEVSSFQMENTQNLVADVAILLNVQPDHLNRHGNMECYKALKLKMFASVKSGAPAILPEQMDDCGAVPAALAVQRFGVRPDSDWHWKDGCIIGAYHGRQVLINLQESWFNNAVFGVSASAAATALTAIGLSAREIEKGLLQFVPLEHRMEQFLCSSRGIFFINDSKATSLTALCAALKMVKTPLHLIAGGLLKEKISENIKELLTRGTKKVYLIGNSCEQMFDAWSDTVLCVECNTLEEAVKASVREAVAGETVLFSPGTASFDQFNSYCERGERFKELVRAVAD